MHLKKSSSEDFLMIRNMSSTTNSHTFGGWKLLSMWYTCELAYFEAEENGLKFRCSSEDPLLSVRLFDNKTKLIIVLRAFWSFRHFLSFNIPYSIV